MKLYNNHKSDILDFDSISISFEGGVRAEKQKEHNKHATQSFRFVLSATMEKCLRNAFVRDVYYC